MEINLSEPSEDLQEVYKSHALFHLSQQNHTAQLDNGSCTAADQQLNTDHGTSNGIVSHTSLNPDLNPDLNQTINGNPKTCLSQAFDKNLEANQKSVGNKNLNTVTSPVLDTTVMTDAYTPKFIDLNKEVVAISEDSTSVDSTKLETKELMGRVSNIGFIAAEVVEGKQLKINAKTMTTGYFGSESSSFSLSNVNEDAEETADQLNNEGPKIVDSTAIVPNAQNNEIHLQNLQSDHEIPNIDTNIHPVKLSKSIKNCDKPVKVPDSSKLKVVDLMDLSSISELKRLWRKSEGEEKRHVEPPRKIKLKSVMERQRKDGGINSVKVINPKSASDKTKGLTGHLKQVSNMPNAKPLEKTTAKVVVGPRKVSNMMTMTPIEKLRIKIGRPQTEKVPGTESNIPGRKLTGNIGETHKGNLIHSLTPLNKIKANVARPVTTINVHGTKPAVKAKGKVGRPQKDASMCSSTTPQGMKVIIKQNQHTSCKSPAKTATNKTTGAGLDTYGKQMKKCSVKLCKVDNLDFSNTGITVDLTVARSTKPRTTAGKTLSKKMVKKVTNYVANSVGLTSKTAKKEVTKFTMKAIKIVSKKVKKGTNTQLTTTRVLEREIKQEPSEGSESAIEVGVLKADDTYGVGDLDEGEMDFLCDSSDEYIPSDEEFRPSKSKTLKDAFLKTKKRKRKNSFQGQLSKKVKVNSMDEPTGNGDSQKPKRKYVRRNIATKRIGRPPVLGLFQCKNCPFTANEKNLVDKHAKVKHARTSMPCRYCDAVFYAENTLLEHEARKHTNDKPFKCKAEGCDYASKCMIDLQRHQSKHAKEKSYVCSLCGWTTKWQRNLRSHRLMKHSEERKFKCPDCPYTCKRNSDLKQHMFRHSSEKPICCLVCGFMVKTNWELQSHMLSHSKEKPFKCTHPGCNAGTKTRADLNKHMRVHATERNFICEICSKGFKCRQSLNKHYPAHTDVREFSCDVCGNKFKTKAAMRKHLTVHSGIKPFSCDICGMRFSVSSNLRSHSVTHDTTNRPFLCPLCPHAARKQDHLLAHIGSFHGNSYTYFCEFCKKPFARYGPLRLHYKRMHPDLDVSSLGHLDLSLLKMEMKQELENGVDTQAGMLKILKKKDDQSQTNEVVVKVEPQDDSYGDSQRATSEVKDDPEVKDKTVKDTSQHMSKEKLSINNRADSQKRNMCNKENEHDNSKEQNPKNIDDKVVSKNSNGKQTGSKEDQNVDMHGNEMSQEKDSENLTDGKSDKQEELEVVSVDSNDDDTVEEKANSGQAQVLCSSSTAKLVVYKDFRLPLATRGFEFNYEKSGKKPKAWFMDYELMNEKDSAKQKKYLRRIGVLPPLPRGHRWKNSLLAFVSKRRRKLTERIRKSNLQREETALKVNAARKARFHGNYREFETFETLTGNELTESEVKETLGQASESATNKKKKENKKNQPGLVKKAVKGTKKQSPKGQTLKTMNLKQKTISKVPKKVKGNAKSKNVLQNASTTGKGGKKSAKVNATRNDVPKKKNSLSSQKRKADTSGEKPKYNKMYVPVKKRKITKENQKNSKEGGKAKTNASKNSDKVSKTASKNDKKTNTKAVKQSSKSKASPMSAKRKKLHVKFASASPHRQVDEGPTNTDTERSNQVVGSIEDTTNYLNAPFQHPSVKMEQIRYPDHILSRFQGEPPDEVSFNQTEAALVNEQGVMLNRVVVLRTNAQPEDTGDDDNDNDVDVNEHSENNQTVRRSTDRDSTSSEQRNESLEKTGPDVSVKSETGDEDEENITGSQMNTNSYVIMDAETGQIKDSLNVQIDGDELDDSGIQIKEELEYE